MLRINSAAISHVGKVRDKNEDNYCFFCLPARIVKDNGRLLNKKRSLKKMAVLGVFDGMGGISAGEKASAIATETTCGILRNSNSSLDDMLKVCSEANRKICNEMINQQKRMGSTASMLCIKENRYYLCNLGDSPVYMLRGNTLSLISHKHTEASDCRKKREKKGVSTKSRLTQYLGIFPEEAELAPYYTEGKCREGDKFLLCSDGLTDVVSLKAIREILRRPVSIRENTSELLRLALDNDSRDNITVICAEIIKSPLISRIFG